MRPCAISVLRRHFKFIFEMRGFTLIELAVVAALLVIISVAAFSNFASSDQIDASREGVKKMLLGAINSGVRADRANKIVQGQSGPYLNPLDTHTGGWCNLASPCLSSAITPPVDDSRLYKYSNNCYGMDEDRDGIINGTDSTNNPDWCLVYDATMGLAYEWLGSSALCNDNDCNQIVEASDAMIVCHNSTTKVINVNAWPGHQQHGDTAGPCQS